MESRNQQIGALVRLAREMRGRKQADVANVLDLSQPRYAQKELGRVDWSVNEIIAVADYLQVKFERLMPPLIEVKRTRRKAA